MSTPASLTVRMSQCLSGSGVAVRAAKPSFRPWPAIVIVLSALLACASPEPGPVAEAAGYIRDYYIRDIARTDLEHAALKGIVTRLDPQSTYLSPAEFREFKAAMQGLHRGVGAAVSRDGNSIKFVSVLDDGPAAQAGIRRGDTLRQVDGIPVAGSDLESVAIRLHGAVGSTISLTVSRADAQPFEVTLTRDAMRIEPIGARLESGRLGYARIAVFNELTEARLIAAIDQLKRKAGGRLNGFILDLRKNPGGLVSEAIAVAGNFLDAGAIL